MYIHVCSSQGWAPECPLARFYMYILSLCLVWCPGWDYLSFFPICTFLASVLCTCISIRDKSLTFVCSYNFMSQYGNTVQCKVIVMVKAEMSGKGRAREIRLLIYTKQHSTTQLALWSALLF